MEYSSIAHTVDYAVLARKSAAECEGMTVRQLSRLWRYVGSERPLGEGVGVSNGIGNLGSGLEVMGNGGVVIGAAVNGRVVNGAKVTQKVGK